MSNVSKPTVLIVPGAWHVPKHFEPLAEKLRHVEYHTVTLSLPSVGGDPPIDTFDEDVQVISNAVREIADARAECIVVLHSYAGVPGSEALQGLSKQERSAAGKPGGVVAIVFLSSFILLEGQRLFNPGQVNPPHWEIQVRDSEEVTVLT